MGHMDGTQTDEVVKVGDIVREAFAHRTTLYLVCEVRPHCRFDVVTYRLTPTSTEHSFKYIIDGKAYKNGGAICQLQSCYLSLISRGGEKGQWTKLGRLGIIYTDGSEVRNAR
jgi:hypothetical protein